MTLGAGTSSRFLFAPPCHRGSPRFGAHLLLIAAIASFAPSVAFAQRTPPHIGYVYPAGGRQGTTFLVTVGGQYFNGADAVRVSGGGVQARVVAFNRPLTPKEFNGLRERAQQLQEKLRASRTAALAAAGAGPAPAWTPQDEKELAETRRKIAAQFYRQTNPVLGETATIEIRVAGDATPGERDLRLQTPNGLSNPLVFCVGQLPEFTEPVATPEQMARPGLDAPPPTARPKPALNIMLPAIVNGQILPGADDRFRFAARKGQRLVFAVRARALIPYLADAVPGWIQATLTLYDAKGRELAYDDDFRFNPDPVLAYVIRADGDYEIAIHDAIYRGREDFVYRLTAGELPFITGLFPLGCRAGTSPVVELSGWNLPSTQMTVAPADQKPGTLDLSVRSHDVLSNQVPFAVDLWPETREVEPNDGPAQAQPITPPVIVNGRIDRPGDQDVFRFEGRAGDRIVAEVFARRLNSPLDSVLKLMDAAGRQLAFNDDHEDPGAGLETHHADSRIEATLSSDGTYYLYLYDAQHHGGAEYGYRLHVGPPRPDFELRVVPSTLNVRAGSSVPLTLRALRRDGFAGAIELALRDAGPGFTLSGARIPAGQDQVQLTLGAQGEPPDRPQTLTIVGRAMIGGRAVTHAAVPADDRMQAFAYRHLVPANELLVDVMGRGPMRGAMRIAGAAPLRIPAGGMARIEVAVPAPRYLDAVQLELSDPPDGITLHQSSTGTGVVSAVIMCDRAKAKPGLEGNLVFLVFGERSVPAADKGKQPAMKQRLPLGALPAMPFEVVAR